MRGADWSVYGARILAEVSSLTPQVYGNLSIDRQIAHIIECVRVVRILRNRFQRARAANAENLAQLGIAFWQGLAEYKRLNVSTKEPHWGNFASNNGDDPWGKLYKICRSTKKTVDIEGICVDNMVLELME